MCFQGVALVIINLSDLDDQLDVESSPANTQVFVNFGNGSDTVNIFGTVDLDPISVLENGTELVLDFGEGSDDTLNLYGGAGQVPKILIPHLALKIYVFSIGLFNDLSGQI